MKRYPNDPLYARIERLADLIDKGARYHAVKMVKQEQPRHKGTWAALMTLEGK